MVQRSLLPVAVMGLVALLSCSSGRQPDAVSSSLNGPAPVPGAAIDSVLWMPDGRLVFGTYTQESLSAEVWEADVDGANTRRLALPGDPGCRKTQYRLANALEDGQLALMRSCYLPLSDLPKVRANSVVAYDVASGTMRKLADLGDSGLVVSSWSIAESRGLGDANSGTCGGIAWLTPAGTQAIPAVVRDGSKTMRLDAWLGDRSSASCVKYGRAACPVWQPERTQVAFFASPGSIGVDSQARLDVPWQLYLLDSKSLRVVKAVDDVRGSCTGLSWSPDGRWLAFTGNVSGTSGIWLYSPTSKALRLVSAADPSSPSWSPDGKKVIAVEDLTDDYPPKTRLVVADVARITGKSA